MFSGEKELAVLNRAYEELDNYKVVPGSGPADTVILLFSSKGLYNANSFADFEQKILKKDRYEWENLIKDPALSRCAGTFILVRDILMDLWMNGINARANTPEKTAALLKVLIGDGKKVVTCGSSAGGNAAMLFGTMLDAAEIYAFSPISNVMQYDRFRPVKHLEEFKTDPDRAPYLEISNAIRNYKGKLYYFYPCKCPCDIAQYDSLKDVESIRFLMCRQKKHGTTIFPESMITWFTLSDDGREELYRYFKGRSFDRYAFMRKLYGTREATVRFIRLTTKKFRKKMTHR